MLPGFGTQRFAVTSFGRGARNITVRIDRVGRSRQVAAVGSSRTVTVTPLED